jgi:hypothetical protein
MGRPYPGAKESLEHLRDVGFHIVIHTCRARSPQGVPDPDPALQEYLGGAQHVADWLDYFEIPYDEITALKPMAVAYIDDKGVAFTGDWKQVEMEVLAMYYSETRL